MAGLISFGLWLNTWVWVFVLIIFLPLPIWWFIQWREFKKNANSGGRSSSKKNLLNRD